MFVLLVCCECMFIFILNVIYCVSVTIFTFMSTCFNFSQVKQSLRFELPLHNSTVHQLLIAELLPLFTSFLSLEATGQQESALDPTCPPPLRYEQR